jgi:hypothetical protein
MILKNKMREYMIDKINELTIAITRTLETGIGE